jgi:hypothetical protein
VTREETVAAIRLAAEALGTPRLSIPAFRQQTGIPQSVVLRHFDSWSEACQAAGVACGPTAPQSRTRRVSEDDCILEMRRVAELLGQDRLSTREFGRYAKFTAKLVINQFGSWQVALDSAGLLPSEKTELDRALSKDECVVELRRVVSLLDHDYVTAKDFDQHGGISSYRIVRVFGSWHQALDAAGLQPSPNFIREVPFDVLASDFLEAAIALGRLPTLHQLTRRSRYASHTFAGRHGGYGKFKRRAIDQLFSSDTRIPPAIRVLLVAEQARLVEADDEQPVPPAMPHKQGRTLGFRAFAYGPTCEHDVVQMFGAVAQELGFEIVGNRSAFPDCEARRRVPGARESFVSCLVEYEYASSDFRRHGHPSAGCDLVVCWAHDWAGWPVEVLELQSVIRRLPGWN